MNFKLHFGAPLLLNQTKPCNKESIKSQSIIKVDQQTLEWHECMHAYILHCSARQQPDFCLIMVAYAPHPLSNVKLMSREFDDSFE